MQFAGAHRQREPRLVTDTGDVLAAKDDGHLTDWPELVGRLRDRPATTMVVTDPRSVCAINMGQGSAISTYLDWELSSPVARAMPGHHRLTECAACPSGARPGRQ